MDRMEIVHCARKDIIALFFLLRVQYAQLVFTVKKVQLLQLHVDQTATQLLMDQLKYPNVYANQDILDQMETAIFVKKDITAQEANNPIHAQLTNAVHLDRTPLNPAQCQLLKRCHWKRQVQLSVLLQL